MKALHAIPNEKKTQDEKLGIPAGTYARVISELETFRVTMATANSALNTVIHNWQPLYNGDTTSFTYEITS